jgi:hypothetical protein
MRRDERYTWDLEIQDICHVCKVAYQPSTEVCGRACGSEESVRKASRNPRFTPPATRCTPPIPSRKVAPTNILPDAVTLHSFGPNKKKKRTGSVSTVQSANGTRIAGQKAKQCKPLIVYHLHNTRRC